MVGARKDVGKGIGDQEENSNLRREGTVTTVLIEGIEKKLEPLYFDNLARIKL